MQLGHSIMHQCLENSDNGILWIIDRYDNAIDMNCMYEVLWNTFTVQDKKDYIILA